MANDLVVQLGAKLEQFASDMSQAGDLADSAVGRIEESFARLNPGISVSNLAAGLAVAGGAAVTLIGLVAALNTSLAQTAMAAERAGLSFERFQQLKFGASSIGVKDSDFSTSLDSFVSKLQDAKSKENDLKRVFDANGVTITESNGKLKDTNDLITKAVDIIKRAPSIQDALQIGTFLGLSREFSQNIFDAGDNFLRLASQANAAGAVIDDATIDKARIFDREWTRASALWGANLRAALGDVLPLLNDAVSGALAVINAVKVAYSFISAIKDFAVAPNIETASLNKLNSLLIQFEEIKKTLQAGQPLDPILGLEAGNIPRVGEKPTVEEVQKVIDAIRAKIEGANKSLPRIVIQAAPSVNPGLKPKGESRDQFEIAVDDITKRTATIKADTAAVFENNAVQAQLRAEFRELTAIMRDHGEVTQAQIDKYEKLRQTMSAQQALTAAGITLTKEHRDAFLSSSEGIETATSAYDKARDSLNKINSASSQIGSALSTAFADAIVEGKSLNDVFSNLIKTLEKAAINSIFASIFTPGFGGGPSPFASFLGLGKVGKNAEGTDNWQGGPTWVGEKGPEIVNLPRGAQVVPNNVASRSGGGVNIAPVYNIDATGADAAALARLERTVVSLHQSIETRALKAMGKYQTRVA
jgi:hypothetical protein